MKKFIIINMLFLLFVFVLIFPCFSADCAEYGLFKEILGHPLDSGDKNMAVDKDGMLWVCSGGLVFRHDGTNWEDFTEISGEASLVSASSDGVLWFADEGKLARFDGTNWTYFSEDIVLPENLRVISAGPNNILWLVFYDWDEGYNYLARFNGEELVTYREGFLQKHIGRVTSTIEGGVWIVYHNFFDSLDCFGDSCPIGTSYFDGTTFYHFTGENGLSISELGYTDVSWIIQDTENGDIYAICNHDLYTYSNETWSRITSILVSGILVNGNDGKIWNGYMGVMGAVLASLNDDEWIDYNVSEIFSMIFDELITPYSSTMVVTPDGMVWMGFNVLRGTNGGVLRINPSTLNSTYVELEQPNTFSFKISSHPNPFNSLTTLTFIIVKQIHVTLEVYSITGQKVSTLVEGVVSAGEHSVRFDGSNLASGIYFYRFISKGFEKSGRMVLLK